MRCFWHYERMNELPYKHHNIMSVCRYVMCVKSILTLEQAKVESKPTNITVFTQRTVVTNFGYL